jgi:hypothetical protein
VISIISDQDAEKCATMTVKERPRPEDYWDRPVALCLSDGLLDSAPKGLDIIRAATAYVSMGAAALPAAGNSAHLERASLLALATPVCSSGARDEPYVRLLDLNDIASHPNLRKVYTIGASFSWDIRVGQATYVRKRVPELPGEENLRILAGVWGSSLIRHQVAAAYLAQLYPLYLLPQERGLLALRRFPRLAVGPIEPILLLLRTQVDEMSQDTLFYSLARDVRLK